MSWAPQVPVPLLADKNLDANEKVILAVILGYIRPIDAKLTCWPSNASLVANTNLSVATVKRALAVMEALGYLRRSTKYDKKRGGRRRLMTVTLPYEGWNSVKPAPLADGRPEKRGGVELTGEPRVELTGEPRKERSRTPRKPRSNVVKEAEDYTTILRAIEAEGRKPN